MRDAVHYALPFGLLGRLAHTWPVQADLKTIFEYRSGKVSALNRKDRPSLLRPTGPADIRMP